MNMTQKTPSRDDLRLAARALGEMLSHVGDFYDVAEEIAIGYANESKQEDASRERFLSLKLGALNELQSVANNVMEWVVDDMRDEHMSWQQVGDVLDVSRQAAQQRFGPKG